MLSRESGRTIAQRLEQIAQFQEKAEDSLAYKAGYAAGLGLLGWLVLRFFRRRRD